MKGSVGVCAALILLPLAACGGDDAAENLQSKAEQLDRAADQAPDEAQEAVLRNQAEALRKAAEDEEKADANGSVTVIKE